MIPLFTRLTGPTLLVVSLLLTTVARADAFDLTQLGRQLSEPKVIRGNFTQEKYLRALPQPLVSTGTFVLLKITLSRNMPLAFLADRIHERAL